MAKLPPELEKRFTDPKPLGSGSFGRVLRVTRVEDGQVVALKLLSPAIAQVPELRERFAREAAAGARVDSPRVVRVLEAGVLGEPYLAMEYVAGHDLEEELRLGGGRLPPERADRVFADVLAGLAAVHAAGMLHRDLKPANVLVDEDGRARLTDFGLVRLVGEDTLTKTGMVLGTPLYMAPEQMLGGLPSQAWDLYAATAMYLQLWTRAEPFPGEGPGDILTAKQKGPEETALAGLPPALAAFLREALSPDPDRRPGDVGALREAWHAARAAGWNVSDAVEERLEPTVRLDAAAAAPTRPSEPLEAPTSVPASAPAAAPRRGGSAWILAGGLVLMVASFAASWEPSAGPPAPTEAARLRMPEDQARLLRELPDKLRGLPTVDYVLREFLGPSKPSDVDRRWGAAVGALRTELARPELGPLLDGLFDYDLRRDELDALGQVVLTWWLFSRTRGAGGDILHEYLKQGEHLEEALVRHTGARDEEAVNPWIPVARGRSKGVVRTEYRAANLAALHQRGGNWSVLYGSQGDALVDPRNHWTLYAPEGFSEWDQGRIRKTTIFGERFPPAQEGGLGTEWTVFARDMSQKEVEIARHKAQERSDPEVVEMHLGGAWTGPLELVLVGYGFDESSPLVLTLVGGEERVRVPVLMPLRSGRPDEVSQSDEPRTARRVRLPAHVLPAGLHLVEARIHAIQCMGAVIQAATLENVYLRRPGVGEGEPGPGA
jgi:hypothetical protein